MRSCRDVYLMSQVANREVRVRVGGDTVKLKSGAGATVSVTIVV